MRPTVQAGVVWRDGYDRALYDIVIGEQRPLVLIGRNSGSSSRTGACHAAENLFRATDVLAERWGMDVRALLPDEDELVETLMASANKVRSFDGDGEPFLNRFVLLDYSSHGFVVSFSTGSATKTDEEHSQPHVRWVQRLLRELEPAGFFASQFDRVSRVPWQTNMLVDEVRRLESRRGSVWVGDGENGTWATEVAADLLHTVRGQQANAAARQFRERGVRAQAQFTGNQVVDGQVDFAIAGGVPPGFFKYRDRRSGRAVLCVDSPQFYPDKEGVLHGLPTVRDAAGELVDQAETLRWFFRTYALPGVTVREVFAGLMHRRYSTQGLRVQRDQGPSSFYGGPTKPIEAYASDACQSWLRAIFDNLDLYESG